MTGAFALLLLLAAAGAPAPAAAQGADALGLTEGALAPEGAASNMPGSIPVAFDQPLVVDLRSARSIRALLLQADSNDVYAVEISDDELTWRPVWRAPRVEGTPGLRTRTLLLPAPVTGRFLRIRPTTGDGAYFVSRLRAYAVPPSPWPPALDYSLPGARPPLLPALTPSMIAPLKAAIGGLALLAACWALLARPAEAKGASPRARRTFLATVALLAALSWWNFLNLHYHGFVHDSDFYHYYIGAKYFPELGYTRLYECSAAAEAVDGRVEEVRARQMRNLETDELVSAAAVAANPEACRSRFAAERWEAFRHDVRYFREAMGPPLWADSQVDHGFNATPVWIVAGRALASLAPASRTQVALLASLDVVLVLLVWLLVLLAFGFEPFCFAVIYFGLNGLSRFAWTGGAFLRYDWLFWAVAGVVALRRGRMAVAGFAVGYSALLRLFPACLVVGLALKALGEVVARRKLTALARYRSFSLGLIAAAAVLVPLSVWACGSPTAWQGFRDNTRRLLATEAANFIGLGPVCAYRSSTRSELSYDPLLEDPFADWSRAQAEASRASAPLLAALSLAFLALLARAVVARPDWAAAILGMGLVPVALKSAQYYYSWLLLHGLLYELLPGAGLGLVGVAWASNIIAELFPQYDERAVAFSVLVLVYVAYVTVSCARRPNDDS